MTSIIRTADGSNSILSDRFGVTYHSKFGAITESNHVFIETGFRIKAVQGDIAVLEAGFGTGLNAMMTWLEAERIGARVQYVALEAFPLDMEAAAKLDYAAQLQAPERAEDFLKLHTVPWNTPVALTEHFLFEKRNGFIQDFQAVEAFDVVYFDAFDPQIQPELWSEDVMSRMYVALRPQGVLVTYCSQGAFRRNLKKAGFRVEKLPGVQGKWEITRAFKAAGASKA